MVFRESSAVELDFSSVLCQFCFFVVKFHGNLVFFEKAAKKVSERVKIFFYILSFTCSLVCTEGVFVFSNISVYLFVEVGYLQSESECITMPLSVDGRFIDVYSDSLMVNAVWNQPED